MGELRTVECKKRRMPKISMRLAFFYCGLPLAELERYARSVIQIDAEHVGESGGKRLAIDSEQPQPVFRKNEAIRSWLGIHGQVD